MKQKIVLALQQFGPLLPVEVASKTGLDSFMAKAYLEELIAEGKVKISREKIADSNVYYLDGQDSQVQQKFISIVQNHKKTARTYAPIQDLSLSPEVQAKRDAFAQKLAEIEAAEQKRKAQQISNPAPRPQLVQQLPQPTFKPLPALPPRPIPQFPQTSIPEKPEFKPTAEPTPQQINFEKEPIYEPEKERTFIDEAMDWLRMEGYEIIEELSAKKTSVSLLIKVNSDFGKLNFFAKIRDKKSITKADLTAAYAGAMEHNCPAVIITNGELAKSTDIFLEEKGGVVKVKKL
jgi:hypothetical protein